MNVGRYVGGFSMILRRILIIQYEMILRDYLRNTRSIDILGSNRGRVDDLGDELFQLW